MTTFERTAKNRAHRFLLLLLLLHIPGLTLFAAISHSSIPLAFFGSLLICAIPSLLVVLAPYSAGTSVSLATASMAVSAMLIHLGNGKTEYHFHIFTFLAILTCLFSIPSLLAAAGSIAAHHIIGWLLVPKSLFSYDAGFSDVMTHALYVVFETGVCCFIAHQLQHNARARGILEEQIGHTVDEVANGSFQIAAHADTFAESFAKQSRLVDQVSNSSASMRQNVEANLAAATASQSRIRSLTNEVSAASLHLSDINAEMQHVVTTNRKISGIVTLMMEIARQTNILAVNASIEASRSGNLGGGFGVIADQVRDLAVRTSGASSEIEDLISSAVNKVEASAVSLNQISSTFSSVSDATQEMLLSANRILEQGHAEAADIQQIATIMDQISSEAHRLARTSKETIETSNNLSNLSSGLKESLSVLN